MESAASILVDLSGVTFVDEAGKQLLKEMHEQGVRFTATGLLGKSLIKEIECSSVGETEKGVE